jgi:hypothetical protein
VADDHFRRSQVRHGRAAPGTSPCPAISQRELQDAKGNPGYRRLITTLTGWIVNVKGLLFHGFTMSAVLYSNAKTAHKPRQTRVGHAGEETAR